MRKHVPWKNPTSGCPWVRSALNKQMTYLELDKQVGERELHFTHKLFHEFCHFIVWDALTTKSKVEWISEIFGVVCAEVQADRNCGLWTNPEQQLLKLRRYDTPKWPHPAPAMYKDSFPIEMGIPFKPKSPRPSMRDPSVTTEMRASSLRGQLLKIWPIFPLSLMEMN